MNDLEKPMDAEERRIMEGLEAAGEISSAPDAAELKEVAVRAARRHQRKTERINIRLTPDDLAGIKSAAEEEAIPYQTLVSHLIRRYLRQRTQRSD